LIQLLGTTSAGITYAVLTAPATAGHGAGQAAIGKVA
jgi:hypothetical protein